MIPWLPDCSLSRRSVLDPSCILTHSASLLPNVVAAMPSSSGLGFRDENWALPQCCPSQAYGESALAGLRRQFPSSTPFSGFHISCCCFLLFNKRQAHGGSGDKMKPAVTAAPVCTSVFQGEVRTRRRAAGRFVRPTADKLSGPEHTRDLSTHLGVRRAADEAVIPGEARDAAVNLLEGAVPRSSCREGCRIILSAENTCVCFLSLFLSRLIAIWTA